MDCHPSRSRRRSGRGKDPTTRQWGWPAKSSRTAGRPRGEAPAEPPGPEPPEQCEIAVASVYSFQCRRPNVARSPSSSSHVRSRKEAAPMRGIPQKEEGGGLIFGFGEKKGRAGWPARRSERRGEVSCRRDRPRRIE